MTTDYGHMKAKSLILCSPQPQQCPLYSSSFCYPSPICLDYSSCNWPLPTNSCQLKFWNTKELNLQPSNDIINTGYLFILNALILWYCYSTASCSAIQLWKADSRIKFFGPFPLPSMEKSFANSIFQVISLIIFGEISLALASWSIEKFWRLGFLHRVHIAWV